VSSEPPNASRVLRGSALPVRILDLPRPPSKLFVRGELPRGPAVAIVGTRKPTEPAREFARELAGELARAGVAVLSGGAEGIDTDAHVGALAQQGITVVVAPAGFHKPFPAENAALFREIVERGGAYLSLVGDDVAPRRGAFFRRNACLVALAHALVVVEAPFRSGARNAAATARKLGRLLFVVPHAPWNPTGQGCLLELKRGARVLESYKDVLRALADAHLHALGRAHDAMPFQASLPFPGDEPRPSGPRDEAAELDEVLAAVRNGAHHADAIGARTGLGVGLIQHRLLTLSLGGVLVLDPAGRIRLL